MNEATPSVMNRWEWHVFDADGWAHLYQVTELENSRLEMLLPWCLLCAPFPLEHDRASISPRVVAPQPGWTCPACLAGVGSCIPHPRTGTRSLIRGAADARA